MQKYHAEGKNIIQILKKKNWYNIINYSIEQIIGLWNDNFMMQYDKDLICKNMDVHVTTYTFNSVQKV